MNRVKKKNVKKKATEFDEVEKQVLHDEFDYLRENEGVDMDIRAKEQAKE